MSKDNSRSQKPDPSSLDRFLSSNYEPRDHLESTRQFIGTIGENAIAGLAYAANRSSKWLGQQTRNGLDELVSRVFGLGETTSQPEPEKEHSRDEGRDR